MKIPRKSNRSFPESSSSSDIAFLLIIYFIVIAGFNVNKGFLLNLPARDSTRLVLKDDLLRAELDGEGSITLQGEETDWEEAEREIRAAVALRPNVALVLTIAPETAWQSVVSFVEMAQTLNVDSFSFSMKKRGDGGPEG
jgi:biopolymer transport protein ExbD